MIECSRSVWCFIVVGQQGFNCLYMHPKINTPLLKFRNSILRCTEVNNKICGIIKLRNKYAT